MDDTLALRKKVKAYIDKADPKTLKLVHAMLEAEDDYNDWDSLPNELKSSLTNSIKQASEGKLIPHEEVVKTYKKCFTK